MNDLASDVANGAAAFFRSLQEAWASWVDPWWQGTRARWIDPWWGHAEAEAVPLVWRLVTAPDWQGLLPYLLILWAVMGLTFIHLGVHLVRGLYLLLSAPRRIFRPREETLPPAELPTFGVVVPAHNEEEGLDRMLESVFAQTVPVQEVIVVDDASTDGTPQVLERWKARGVRVVRRSHPGGKIGALETGIAHSTTDLVALIDADCIMDREYVREMHRAFRKPEVAAAGGLIQSLPTTWVAASRQIEYLLTYNVGRSAESHIRSVMNLSGASSTFRREVLVKHGYVADTLCDDLDLTWRLHSAGHRLVMNTRARVYTEDPPTLREYYRQLVRWYTDFWVTVGRQWRLLGKRTFGLVVLPHVLLHVVASSVLYLLLPIYFALFTPGNVFLMFGFGLALDAALAVIGHAVFRSPFVYWSILSRGPTRTIGRFATLYCLVRVLIGRPAWNAKLLKARQADHAVARARGIPPGMVAVVPAGA